MFFLILESRGVKPIIRIEKAMSRKGAWKIGNILVWLNSREIKQVNKNSEKTENKLFFL